MASRRRAFLHVMFILIDAPQPLLLYAFTLWKAIWSLSKCANFGLKCPGLDSTSKPKQEFYCESKAGSVYKLSVSNNVVRQDSQNQGTRNGS